MARPRQFDVDEALDRAMHVFWAKGYEGASLNDLLGAMGIARGSLYKAFADKHAIYLAALDRYDRTVVAGAIATLEQGRARDGAGRIRRFLRSACDPVAARNDRRGCLICNAAVDRAPVDSAVEARVLAMLRRIERAVARAVADSPAGAALSARRRTAIARQITSAYVGLRVLARAGYAAADLESIADATLRQSGLTAGHT